MKVTIQNAPTVGLRPHELLKGRLYQIVAPELHAGGIALCTEELQDGSGSYHRVVMVHMAEEARKQYLPHLGSLIQNTGFRYRELTNVELTATLK